MMSLSSRFGQIHAVTIDSTEDEQEEEDEILQRLLGKKNPVKYSVPDKLTIESGRLAMPDNDVEDEDEEMDGSWASDFQSILKSKKDVESNPSRGITAPSVDSLPADLAVNEKRLPLSPYKVSNVELTTEKGDNIIANAMNDTECTHIVKKKLYAGDGFDKTELKVKSSTSLLNKISAPEKLSEKHKHNISNDKHGKSKKGSPKEVDTYLKNNVLQTEIASPDNDCDIKEKFSTSKPSTPIRECSIYLMQLNKGAVSKGSTDTQAICKSLAFKSPTPLGKDSAASHCQPVTVCGNVQEDKTVAQGDKKLGQNENKKLSHSTSVTLESDKFNNDQNKKSSIAVSPLSKHHSTGKNKENEKSHIIKRNKKENEIIQKHKNEKINKLGKANGKGTENIADKTVSSVPNGDKILSSHSKRQHTSVVKDVHKSKSKKMNKKHNEPHTEGNSKTSVVLSKQKSTDQMLNKPVKEHPTTKNVCLTSPNKIHRVAKSNSSEKDAKMIKSVQAYKLESHSDKIESVHKLGVIDEKLIESTNEIKFSVPCVQSKTSESQPVITVGKSLTPEASKNHDVKKAKSFKIKPSTSFPLDDILPVKKRRVSGDVHTATKLPHTGKTRHNSETTHSQTEPRQSDGDSTRHGRYEAKHNFNDIRQSFVTVPNVFNEIDGFQEERNFYQMTDQWYEGPSQCNEIQMNNDQQNVFHGEQFGSDDKPPEPIEEWTAPAVSVSDDVQEIMSAMEGGNQSLLCLIQDMLNKQIGTNLKALSQRTQEQQSSDLNLNAEPYSPTRPSIGFYTERSDDSSVTPSYSDNSEKTAREKTDKLFHQFVKQCSALVKTTEDKSKLISLVNLIKTEGGTELTGTGFTPDVEDNEHSNPSTEATNVSCPSQMSGYSPPSFSPDKQEEEKLIFEGRTLLKGGVKPRHIPKCFGQKCGKEWPLDPRKCVYGEEYQQVCLPLPVFASAVWGEEKVRLILCKDWSVTHEQTGNEISSNVYVPATVRKTPTPITFKQNNVETPVKDEQIRVVTTSEPSCGERKFSSVYGTCSDTNVKFPESNDHVDTLDDILCNTNLELAGVSSFNSKSKAELVDALTGFMQNTSELTKLSFLPKVETKTSSDCGVKPAVQHVPVVTNTANLKQRDSKFQNSIPVLVGYSTSNSSISDYSSCDASSHAHYWRPAPHHTDGKRKKILINLKNSNDSVCPDKGPNVGIVKPMITSTSPVVKSGQDDSKNCQIVNMDLDSDLEDDETSIIPCDQVESTNESTKPVKNCDTTCLTPKTSLKDEFAKEKQKINEKQNKKQEIVESTEYLRRLKFEGRSESGSRDRHKYRNYRTYRSPSPSPSVGSKRSDRSSLERPIEMKFRPESRSNSRSSNDRDRDYVRSNYSSSHSEHRRRSLQETNTHVYEHQNRKRHHTTAVYSGVDSKRGRHIHSSSIRQSHRSNSSDTEWYRYSHSPQQLKHENKKSDRDESSDRVVELVKKCNRKESSPEGIGNLNRQQKWFQSEKRSRSPILKIQSTCTREIGCRNKLPPSNQYNVSNKSLKNNFNGAPERRYVSVAPKMSNPLKSEVEMTDEEFVKEYREKFNRSIITSPVVSATEKVCVAPPTVRTAPPKPLPVSSKESSERLDRDRQFLMNYVKKIDTIEHVKHEKIKQYFPDKTNENQSCSVRQIQSSQVVGEILAQQSDESSKSKVLIPKPLKSKLNVSTPNTLVNMAKKGIIKIHPKIGSAHSLKTKPAHASRECLSYKDVLPVTELEDGEVQ